MKRDQVMLHIIQKKQHTVKTLSSTIAILLFTTLVGAQDIHYTQFYNAPFQNNPALVGIFQGDIRLMTNYREQWSSVPVEYRTLTAAADFKLPSSDGKSFFAVGGAINFDQAGFSRLNQTNVNVLGSYTRRMGRRVFATAGLQFGVNYRAFDIGGISFGNQWDPRDGVFNPGGDTGEQFGSEENWYVDLGTGFNLRYQTQEDRALVDRLERRTKFDVGVGIHHLNTPNQNFLLGPDIALPVRVSPYFSGTFQMGDNIDLLTNVTAQFQGNYEQYLFGVAGKIHLNRDPGKQLALVGGASMRTNQDTDSWSPVFELHYNLLRVGFSYDINVSDLNIATDRRSGPELSIRWMIRKVPVLDAKTCPLI